MPRVLAAFTGFWPTVERPALMEGIDATCLIEPVHRQDVSSPFCVIETKERRRYCVVLRDIEPSGNDCNRALSLVTRTHVQCTARPPRIGAGGGSKGDSFILFIFIFKDWPSTR